MNDRLCIHYLIKLVYFDFYPYLDEYYDSAGNSPSESRSSTPNPLNENIIINEPIWPFDQEEPLDLRVPDVYDSYSGE